MNRFANTQLTPDDPRLPAVRARVFTLLRSLWKAGVLRVPVTDTPPDHDTWPFLPAVWRLLRVELLGRELVERILPEVERHLHAGGDWRREETRLPASGPIDWPATWQRWHRTLPGEPTVVARRWQRAFDLPENQLAVLALEQLLTDVERLAVPLRAAGVQDAARVADVVSHTRNRPPWVWVDSVPAATEVVRQARARIHRLGGHRPAYPRLLDWWERFARRRTTTSGDLYLEDPGPEPDLLFELLVLLELVLAFAARTSVRQLRPLAGPDADPTRPLFSVDAGRAPITIYYQTGSMFSAQRRLREIWGIPDIVLALSEPTRYVVLDAKNYGPSNHSEALYKMMGYLYNFGFPNAFERISAGVLAFPSVEREGTGLYAWHPDDEQALFSLAVPPLPNEEFTGMAEFVAWLLSRS